MAIFTRDSELPAESQVEYPSHSGRRWPVLVAYIIAALLVATAVVFAGRWVYRQATKSDNTNKVATNPPASSGNTHKVPAGSNSTPPPPPTSTKTPTTNPGNLPNNGPGEVIALFVGSSFAAAGLHYIVQIRRV